MSQLRNKENFYDYNVSVVTDCLKLNRTATVCKTIIAVATLEWLRCAWFRPKGSRWADVVY